MTNGLPVRPGLRDEGVLEIILESQDEVRRPLLLTHAFVRTMDPRIGDLADADLLLDDALIVAVGPGLRAGTEHGDAIVIDCTGLTIVPAAIDTAAYAGPRPGQRAPVRTLVPGNPATFGVIQTTEASAGQGLEMLVWHVVRAAAIVADGTLRQWNGRPLVAHPTAEPTLERLNVDSEYLGTWIDVTGFVHQHLTADGRYDETRGGRPHAYQGSFWIDGDWIIYLDDLGFWAYGQFRDDVLHHAGYIFHRQ